MKLVLVASLASLLFLASLALPHNDANEKRHAAKVFAKFHAAEHSRQPSGHFQTAQRVVPLTANLAVSSSNATGRNVTVPKPTNSPISSPNTTQAAGVPDAPIDAQNNGTGIVANDELNPSPTALSPLPLDITWEGVPLVVRGRCVESCRPSQARDITQFSWTTSRPEALPYEITTRLGNRLVVRSVNFATASEDSPPLPALSGFVPPEAPTANASTASSRFSTIQYLPECLSSGQVKVHVVITGAEHHEPIHLFFRTVCSVPENPLCDKVDCGLPGRGVCLNGTCHCARGYSGPHCGASVFDACPLQCHGNADDCRSAPESGEAFRCACKRGYGGDSCDRFVGCDGLGLNRCSGHGQCIDGEACGCDYGWTGRACDQEVGGDSRCSELSFCSGRGSCHRNGNSFSCQCDDGFAGTDCSRVVPGHCPAQCSGHGVCNNGVCECNFGFSGEDCGTAFSPCGGCNGGTCSESVDDSQPHCQCPLAFGGRHCTDYDKLHDPCRNSSFCSGHGKCPHSQGYCECDSGFDGKSCNRVVSDGCVNSCSGHGTCDASTDSCRCHDNWSGEGCSTPRCPAVNETMCSGHGACVAVAGASVDSRVCQCVEPFFGVSCSNAVCKANSTCGAHGTCKKSSGQWNRLCTCEAGWTGATCREHSALAAVHLASKPAAMAVEEEQDELDDFLNVLPNDSAQRA